MIVEIDETTDYELDASVHCGAPILPDAVVIPHPVIVVEVVSPSTQSFDMAEKLADYFRVASTQHYLIVRTRGPEVIHPRRDGVRIDTRIMFAGPIILEPPGLTLDVAEIYAD